MFSNGRTAILFAGMAVGAAIGFDSFVLWLFATNNQMPAAKTAAALTTGSHRFLLGTALENLLGFICRSGFMRRRLFATQQSLYSFGQNRKRRLQGRLG